ncbi:MAG: hypothetical protein KDA85_17340, partial [Planctomycetaceae bacterium]|nr:hypothetical protein [Planctomycetaceae bacterium]
MKQHLRRLVVAGLATACSGWLTVSGNSAESLHVLVDEQPVVNPVEHSEDTSGIPASARTAFTPMTAAEFDTQVESWIARAAGDSPADAAKARKLWIELAGPAADASDAEQRIDAAMLAFAELDPAIRRLLNECQGTTSVTAPVYDGLRSDPFCQSVVRLFHARWLTQHRYYDEALTELEQLSADDCPDPSALFFYRAVCELSLLNDEAARDQLSLLLNNTADVPPRFRAVAEMMRQQLANAPADGLPQVARTMSDVQRRLDLGRPDTPTQKQEEQVIALLDKLLEEMQNQQQQQSGQGSSGEGQNPQGQKGAIQA